MEKVFYNGCIGTQDGNDDFCEAVGIENGKISFVGSTEDAMKLDCAEKTDLQGRLVLPGFTDSHLHILHYSFVENTIKLFDCRSAEDVLKEVDSAARKRNGEDIPWLFGRGWNEELFNEKRYPLKSELDRISDTYPILLVRVCGHAAVCNTPGLEKLKKIKEFQEIESDVDFETGTLRENAVQFFYSVLEAPSLETVENLIEFGAKSLNEKGITAIQSDDLASLPGKNWRRIVEAYTDLAESGRLSVNVYEQCLFERFDDLKVFIGSGYRTGQSFGNFTIGPVKLIQDGALGARTAALSQTYENDADNMGEIIYDQKLLDEIVAYCDEHQMQIAVHCIGDMAMQMVIDAIERSPARKSNGKGRHGIVHVQISTKEIIDKMKEDDLIAYIQPVFVDLDMDIVEQRVGKERTKSSYAWKTLLDEGVLTCGGSDAPVDSFDVIENIYFAVTRCRLDGTPAGGWMPEQRLSVEEAVRLFTKYPAYASYSEDRKGTIEVGKDADLVILNKNIYREDPLKIKDAKVDMTLLNGETVYMR